MSYIERETALQIIDNYAKTVSEDGKVVVDAIRDIVEVITPTADVVSVVRCKDCVSSRPLNRNDRFEARYCDGCIYCMRTDEGVSKYDYCSYGESREGY